jgi:hypothetical protein
MVIEALVAIRARLGEGSQGRCPTWSGRRAALWRAQHQAARRGTSLEDLRRYCLEWLARPRLIGPEHESDYLRGYREGLQLVLRDLRAIEMRTKGPPPGRGETPG